MKSPLYAVRKHRPEAQKKLATMILSGVVAIMVASGCSTSKIETEPAGAENLPRPDQIFVYDFASTPAEVSPDSAIAREFTIETSKQTAEQSATADAVGSQIAKELVGHLRSAGLPAKHVSLEGPIPPTAVNDIVIRGYLISIKEGSAAKRVMIGFGSGASEFRAAAEVFQVTPHGLESVGSGTGHFGARRTPGAVVGAGALAVGTGPAGLIVSGVMKTYGEVSGSSKIQGRAKAAADEIARVLEKRARKLGWIN